MIMSGTTPCQSTILSAFYPFKGWDRKGGARYWDERAWLEDKNCSHSTIHPSISVPRQSLTGRDRPHFSGLCSQGHWKVGKGEESSWEMPKAGHLEMIPGRKKEAAREGGI